MRGIRKMIVFGAVVASLLTGFLVAVLCDNAVDTVVFTAFVGGVVGAGGWFFKANVDVHKSEKVAQNPGSQG